MIQRPRLKQFLTVFPIADNVWGLRGGSDELWRIKLAGERTVQGFLSLLAHLDGRRTREDILAELAARGSDRELTVRLLDHLEQTALIEDAPAADTADLPAGEAAWFRPQIDYFSRFTAQGGGALQAQLRRSSVAVVEQGHLGRCLVRQLAAAGIGRITLLRTPGALSAPAPPAPPLPARAESPGGTRWSEVPFDRESIWPEYAPEEPAPALLLVPLETHDPQLLWNVDRFSKLHGLPWLLLQATDVAEGWVGPLFVPGETACYLSFEARLQGNAPFPQERVALHRHLWQSGAPAAPCGGLFASFEILAGIAVSEAVKLLTGLRTPWLAGRFLTLDYDTWEIETHEVLRLPRVGLALPTLPPLFPWQEAPAAEQLLVPQD